MKSYCWRQLVFGRRISVMDVKGEYQRLAEAAGGSIIRLDPASATRVNPLDTARAGAGGEQHQLTLVVALAEAALGRDLTPPEHAGCAEALHSARHDHGATPTLPQVVEGLLRPDGTAAERLATTAEGMASECRHAALALRRMVAGDLAGLFDGPTTLDVDLDAPVVVIDLSAVESSSALAVVLTCAAAWLDAQLRRRRGGKRLVVNDEAWRVIAEPGIARWLQSSWKLARSYGVQHIGMLHRLSDLESAGEAGSEQVRMVHGLLADVETRVAYCQPDSEAKVTGDRLGLSDTETAMLSTLPKFRGLWRLGQRGYLVDHDLAPREKYLIDTDEAMDEAASEPAGTTGGGPR